MDRRRSEVRVIEVDHSGDNTEREGGSSDGTMVVWLQKAEWAVQWFEITDTLYMFHPV